MRQVLRSTAELKVKWCSAKGVSYLCSVESEVQDAEPIASAAKAFVMIAYLMRPNLVAAFSVQLLFFLITFRPRPPLLQFQLLPLVYSYLLRVARSCNSEHTAHTESTLAQAIVTRA